MKKEKIKILPILFIALLTLSLVVSAMSFVSAEDTFFEKILSLVYQSPEKTAPESVTGKAIKTGFNVLGFILGNNNQVTIAGATYGEDSVLIARVFLFILLIGLVYSISGLFPTFLKDNAFVRWVLALGVPLIAIRFLTAEMISTILLPYGTLGIALTAIIPFVIYFFFVEEGFKDSSTARKLCWIFFACIFIVLWFVRMSDSTAKTNPYLWIYPLTAVVAIIMFLFDKTISSWFAANALAKIRDSNLNNQINLVNTKIAWLNEVIATPTGNPLPAWTGNTAQMPVLTTAGSNKDKKHNREAQELIKDFKKNIRTLLKSR